MRGAAGFWRRRRAARVLAEEFGGGGVKGLEVETNGQEMKVKDSSTVKCPSIQMWAREGLAPLIDRYCLVSLLGELLEAAERQGLVGTSMVPS